MAEVEAALERFGAEGDVLELACGTGLWTRHLVRTARRVTAVDASAEMIELNRARVGDAAVEYVCADIFAWRPPATYDVCFFGYWLSHVPDQALDGFWETVAAALRPDGRVFFVDSARSEHGHTRPDEHTELRRLSDGREFAIVKRYWQPRALERRLASLGWRVDVATTANGAILYGSGARS